MPNQVKSWSYSRYSDYQQCPRRFKYKHIERRPEPESAAMVRGGAVDTAVTAYLDGTRVFPTRVRYRVGTANFNDVLDFGSLKGDLAKMRKKCDTQLELAVDRQWQPAGWREWDRAWLRAKLDVLVRTSDTAIHIVDNKTGKEYPEKHAEQIEIYAIVAFSHYQNVEEITAQMFYLDLGKASAPTLFTDLKKTIPKLRRQWGKKAAPMFRDAEFRAQPGRWCNWCPYSGNKGGPCDKG